MYQTFGRISFFSILCPQTRNKKHAGFSSLGRCSCVIGQGMLCDTQSLIGQVLSGIQVNKVIKKIWPAYLCNQMFNLIFLFF